MNRIIKLSAFTLGVILCMSENGEVEAIRYVYGRDVKKGKEGVFGYEVLPTSPHAIYFTYSLNTCRQASLYFASEDDAKQFIKEVLSHTKEQYGGKTFLVHPKTQEDGQYIYIDRMYDDGDDYTTEFVIYPPRLQDGFFRIELEVYA